MSTCEHCGRPTWQKHGGMGGSLPPDSETHCLSPGGHLCRVARAGYLAGVAERDALRARVAVPPRWKPVDGTERPLKSLPAVVWANGEVRYAYKYKYDGEWHWHSEGWPLEGVTHILETDGPEPHAGEP